MTIVQSAIAIDCVVGGHHSVAAEEGTPGAGRDGFVAR